MAEGEKWTDQDVATSFDSGDIMSIVQDGANKQLDKDFLFKTFDSGWLSTSTWTTGASITINHGLNTAFDGYFGLIFAREDSSPDKIYNVTDVDIFADNHFGQRLNGIDADLDNCYLQMANTAEPGRHRADSGSMDAVPTSGWSYKVVIYKLS